MAHIFTFADAKERPGQNHSLTQSSHMPRQTGIPDTCHRLGPKGILSARLSVDLNKLSSAGSEFISG